MEEEDLNFSGALEEIQEIRSNQANWKEIESNPHHPKRERVLKLLHFVLDDSAYKKILSSDGSDFSFLQEMCDSLEGKNNPEVEAELDRLLGEGRKDRRGKL